LDIGEFLMNKRTNMGFSKKVSANTTVSVSKPKPKVFTPTPEQETAKNMVLLKDMSKIQACAGSGKTSELVYISTFLEVPSLYMTFNVTMAREAADKFGDHVSCMTTHSLAYRKVGKGYQHKLSRPQGRYVNVALTGSEVARFFRLPDFEVSSDIDDNRVVSKNLIGLLVRDTVNSFEISADDLLDADHLPHKSLRDLEKKYGETLNMRRLRKMIIRFALNLWEERTDKYSEVCCTHNTYLKLYQLSKPDLSNLYEVIYVDEFQDVNPVTRSIVMGQKEKCRLVICGDKFQQIYCQPKGTMVTVAEYETQKKYKYVEKCISEVVVGDRVLSYQIEKSCMHAGGKPVTRVGSKSCDDNLVVVRSEGKVSRYTKDHLVTVRVSDFNDDKYVVYLMQKGNNFRIGIVPWRYKSQNGSFGLAQRCASEQATSAWILKVVDTRREATMYEAMTSYTYNIPQVCFKDRSRHSGELSGAEFWEEFGDNEATVS
jgi:hypothetical protein